MEFYAAERKKELIPFATAWMELESIMLSERSILNTITLMRIDVISKGEENKLPS